MAIYPNSDLFLWSDNLIDLVLEEPYNLMGYRNQFIKNIKGETILLGPAYYLFYQIQDEEEEKYM